MGIKRLKWTEQMNIDCLDCKRKAQELIASENPPVNENGRRKGYIKIMKELWEEAKGYEKLGLTKQNLRDRAARLEKIMSDTSGQSRSDRMCHVFYYISKQCEQGRQHGLSLRANAHVCPYLYITPSLLLKECS